MKRETDVIVVGAGAAGLAVATMLGRSGLRVEVLERSGSPGGRAAAKQSGGFTFNRGAHALYNGGAAARVLAELDVDCPGGDPLAEPQLALQGDQRHRLPTGVLGLLRTSVLGWKAKWEAMKLFARLPRLDTRALDSIDAQQWIETSSTHPELRALLAATVRISTYCGELTRLRASAAVQQIQLGFKGVRYVHGGWQPIVDGLHQRAHEAGAHVSMRAAVRGLSEARGRWAVETDNDIITGDHVVVASSPSVLEALLGRRPAGLPTRADALNAVCLDLALERLPNPDVPFALGLDRPLYFSAHCRVAKLAPSGAALIHLIRYHDGPAAPADAREELEELMDDLQPGWRDLVVERQFLPSITVAHDVPAVGRKRFDVSVPDTPGIYAVGDWVGAHGMLADAALASATEASRRIVAATMQARGQAA